MKFSFDVIFFDMSVHKLCEYWICYTKNLQNNRKFVYITGFLTNPML